jgi:Holliday junction resolvasome RuvABC DNA-binding subunit
VHRGTLFVLRGARGEVRFQHADGSEYGARDASPAVADTRARVFQALRTLGFREAESKLALSRASLDVGPNATVETLLRRALRELNRSRAA